MSRDNRYFLILLFLSMVAVAGFHWVNASGRKEPQVIDPSAAYKNQILENLRVIEAAKQIWFAHNPYRLTGLGIVDLTSYLPGHQSPRYAIAETYEIGDLSTPVTAFIKDGLLIDGNPGPFTLTSF